MTEFATAGSQRWLQIAVDQYKTIINSAFQEALGLSPDDNIDWASPLLSALTSSKNIATWRHCDGLAFSR